ncbi:MAG: hypothetical protein R3Y15_01135 [Rikenellaceae bacterium]
MESKYELISTVRLTVAQSKRLIAKGLRCNKDVQDRLNKGIVVITRGSTNTYIAEEFVGYDNPRGSFVTGKIIPKGSEDFALGLDKSNDIVLIDGVVVDMPLVEAIAKMDEQDIIFKGANLINYSKSQAGICIGAPDGGTVARIKKGKGRWVTPVGLEKDCSADLFEYAGFISSGQCSMETVPMDVTCQSEIYTEVEAIKEFAPVDVCLAAKGGLSGAEGGVSLIICGDKEQVSKAMDVVGSLVGEPSFV